MTLRASLRGLRSAWVSTTRRPHTYRGEIRSSELHVAGEVLRTVELEVYSSEGETSQERDDGASCAGAPATLEVSLRNDDRHLFPMASDHLRALFEREVHDLAEAVLRLL